VRHGKGQQNDGVKNGILSLYGFIKDQRIIPITVSHCTADIDPADFKKSSYCSASFVIEIKNKKVVLLWDIDTTEIIGL